MFSGDYLYDVLVIVCILLRSHRDGANIREASAVAVPGGCRHRGVQHAHRWVSMGFNGVYSDVSVIV